MRWWNKFIGTKFPTEHRHICRFDGATSGHVVTPAEVLMPVDVLNLLTLARQRHGTQGLVCRQIILAVVDVLRFAHRARTRVVSWDARLITFECSAGKRYKRRSGARPAFRYTVPVLGRQAQTWQEIFYHSGQVTAQRQESAQASSLAHPRQWTLTRFGCSGR